MNFNFTDQIRTTLARAREEAVTLGHDYVGTEHLLLALLRDEEDPVVLVLTNLGVRAEDVMKRVRSVVPPGRDSPPLDLGELPYTSRGKKVLEYCMRSARKLTDSYVGTEHLLLALLEEEKGIAAEILGEFGVTYENARDEIVRVLAKEPGETRPAQDGGWLRRIFGSESATGPVPPAHAESGTRFAIDIDDNASTSIYEQIVLRVSEGVATGELRPGDRLPPVRRLADELDIAPGTVARAYTELERSGVVVTDGARGTRIAEPTRQPPETEARPDSLAGLLRPVAVAAFHLGATADDLRAALERAMAGIYTSDGGEAGEAEGPRIG